jgi:hypothetical protein
MLPEHALPLPKALLPFMLLLPPPPAAVPALLLATEKAFVDTMDTAAGLLAAEVLALLPLL